MALSFDANYYLSARPDVFNAFVATAGKTGLTWAQFAENHYNNFGRFEGSNPNAVFNTKEYLAANPDVAAAGVNPFQHYLKFGVNEGRAPSASFPTFASFDYKTYLAANPDLAAAGITTANQAYAHFVVFGEFEGRPGAPVVDTGTPGSTVNLTTSVDTLTGTANNDTFVADNTAGAGKFTLTAADTVNGGAGVDTLKVFSDGTAAGVAGVGTATLSNIEKIYVNNANGQALDVSGIAGVTDLILDRTGASETVTVKAQAVSILNDTGTNTYTIKSGSADAAQTVTVSGVGSSAGNAVVDLNTGAKVVAATINSTGAANFVTLNNTAGALATLTITGDKALTLTDSLSTIKTIDASKASGGVSIDHSGATITSAFAYTGGAGNDSLTLKAGAIGILTAGTQLDAGAGRDTLKINDTSYSAADYAKLAAVKNFEVLALGTDGATIDASQITNFKEFAVSTGTETINNIQAGSTLNVLGATTAVNLGGAVGVNAITVNLGSATAAGFTTTALKTTGFGTVTINDAGTSAHTITTITNSDNTNFVLTGSTDLTITNALSATTTGSKFDASAFTGKLSVVGSAKADILIGGTGADTLKTGGGADTLTGGAGTDKFDVSGSINTGGTIDTTITDAVKGETFVLGAGNGTATWTAAKVDVTGAATLDAAVTLAAAGDGGTNSAVKWFQYGGDTYVVEDNTDGAYAAATDQVIKLVGTHDLSASTFTAAGVTLVHG